MTLSTQPPYLPHPPIVTDPTYATHLPYRPAAYACERPPASTGRR